MNGWICPRCETVHAPSVLQCGCRPLHLAGMLGPLFAPAPRTTYSCRHGSAMPLPCAECHTGTAGGSV